MGAIAERLFAAEAALAPEVTFTGLNVDAVRFFLANRGRIAHLVLQLHWSRKFAEHKEHDQERVDWLESSQRRLARERARTLENLVALGRPIYAATPGVE